jgi:hypothetical protein
VVVAAEVAAAAAAGGGEGADAGGSLGSSRSRGEERGVLREADDLRSDELSGEGVGGTTGGSDEMDSEDVAGGKGVARTVSAFGSPNGGT